MGAEQREMVSLPVLGSLSYKEWHAALDGFYVGYVDGERDHRYDREKHYWRTGYVIGREYRRRRG